MIRSIIKLALIWALIITAVIHTAVTSKAADFSLLHYKLTPTLNSTDVFYNPSGFKKIGKLEIMAEQSSATIDNIQLELDFDCSLTCGYTNYYYGSWLQDTKLEIRDSIGNTISKGVRMDNSLVWEFNTRPATPKIPKLTGWFADLFNEDSFFPEEVTNKNKVITAQQGKITTYYIYIDFFNRKNRALESIDTERYDVTIKNIAAGDSRAEEVRPGGASIIIDYTKPKF